MPPLKSDSVRIQLADADSGPKWHLLFPLGAVKHRPDFPRPISFDEATLRSMEANYVREGKPERAVNFFHLGPSDTPAPIDNKVAAGWIRDVVLDVGGNAERADGPGLYALISWTDRARTYILKDELRYLSPEFVLESTDKNTGAPAGAKLLGAALLNDPYLTELPRVAASETVGVRHMDRKLVCSALGLAESASDEEINSAAKSALEKKAEAEKAEAEAKSGEEKKMAEQEATKLAFAESEKARVTMAEKVALLEKENATLLAEKKAAEVKSFFDGLVREGRCTPALRTGLESIAMSSGLDAVRFLEKAPALVKMGEEGVTGEATPADEKKAAQARFDKRVDELQAKGMRFTEAFDAAKSELREEFVKLFSA